MTLSELRIRLGVPLAGLAVRLQLSDRELGKLEATPVHRVAAGTLASYAAGIGARLVLVRDDGNHAVVKP